MRNFACSGGRLFIFAVLTCLPLTLLRAEGEPAPGSSESISSSTTSSNSTSNIGLGTFSRFPVNFSVSVLGGYDDNVNTTNGAKQGSWFTTAGLVVNYKAGTQRTTLDLSTNTGFTFYDNSATNRYDPNINLALTLSHKATPRLTFAVNAVAIYQTEPDFQYGLGTNRRAGNYFLTTDSISASYLWAPRFTTTTNYAFNAVHYDDMATGFLEDRIENTFGNQFRFLVWPTTNLVGEYRFQVVSYQHDNSLDSTTHFLLGGFDHVFNPRLNAVFRGGVELRNYNNIGQQNSPYFEAIVSYALGKGTSVSWVTRYGIEEGSVATNPTHRSFRAGIQGKYNLTARIAANLSLYFYSDDYDATVTPNPVGGPPIVNPAFTEQSFDVNLSLRYSLTRYFGVEAGYDFTGINSDQMVRDYSRNRVWGGLNVAF